MNLNIHIRHAKPSDARANLGVFFRSWFATYPNKEFGITEDDIKEIFRERLTDEGVQKREKTIAELPSNQVHLVAEVDSEIVGLVLLTKYEEYDQLQAIYVDPEHQGKGVGTSLFNEISQCIDKDLIVHVATYNKNAIRFYEKLGFKDTGKRFTEERHRMPISGKIIPEMEMVLKLDKVAVSLQ